MTPIGRSARVAALLVVLALPPARAQPVRALPPAALEPLDHAVCRLIEIAAQQNRLPVGFVTRVIWHESSFRSAVVSPAGAEGIAQFMPGTAQQRGLADPFDPEQAIPHAARLLAELRDRFGNLGLAAAAYNAGAARIGAWLQGEVGLPAETGAYVRYVTQRDAEDWAGAGSSGSSAPASRSAVAPMPTRAESCLAVTAELRRDEGGGRAAPDEMAPAPWGVQLAGNFSKELALAEFARARQRYAGVIGIGDERPMIVGRLLRSRGTRRFYQVRLPAQTRAAADALCRRIQAVGGACVALRS